MQWCIHCEKMVYPQKQWSWAAFFIWTILLGGLGGLIIYLPWYLIFKRGQCPSCGGKSFKPHAPQVTPQ